MTKAEYISSIDKDADTLEILEDTLINTYSANTKENMIKYLKKDSTTGKATIITKQYFENNNVVYEKE